MRFQSLQEEILWFTFKSSTFVGKNTKHPLFMDVLSSEAQDYSCKVRDICLHFKSFPGIDLTLCLLSAQSLWQRFLLQPHYMPHIFGSCYCDWGWEGLRAGGGGDHRGWDGWMASLTRWTWVWVNSGSWWWTGRPGVLRFTGSQRVRHDWATELTELIVSLWPLAKQK